ncbi:LodA/GoxA family CTQ-dependent oxidase [Sorangium sp. So ce131]|uniref:LodA/GoxA family CTQ-dependent oxidase n=1 Tax=Sorangium sp. So ce131 TaxID=3133282 RepID=UPI003F602678
MAKPLPTIFRIHPAIGIARIGDSPDFFVGPEVPGRPPEGAPPIGTAVPAFKDSAGRIKRQAARFRIWRYVDDGKGRYKPDQEIHLGTAGIKSIEWKVHVANKKAEFFAFNGLLGDPVFGPKRIAPVRRNAAPRPSRRTLWIDPGFRTISGKLAKPVPFRKGTAPPGATESWPTPAPTPPIEYLGELRTDDAGRLLFLGGVGLSSAVGGAPITDYANNDGWFDDVSDGPVTAVIKFTSGGAAWALGAWVLCGPPDFAPFTRNVVSLYDTLFDVAARELVLPANETIYEGPLRPLKEINAELKGKAWGKVGLTRYRPSFDDEIWPILYRGLQSASLFEPAQNAHTSLGANGMFASMYPQLADPSAAGAQLRKYVFDQLHPPGLAGDGLPTRQTMPKLLGDDAYGQWKVGTRRRLTLTPVQYALLERWASGDFVKGSAAPPAPPAAGAITPAGLDRAALENAVGGGFYPGIEVSWQIRHPAMFLEPFRIKHAAPSKYVSDVGVTVGPGHFSRQMALPWQADFLMCKLEEEPAGSNRQWGWWPAQRPDAVYASEADARGRNSMVRWHRATVAGTAAPWATGHPQDKYMPSYSEMLDHWKKLGFVHAKGDVQFEQERKPDVP